MNKRAIEKIKAQRLATIEVAKRLSLSDYIRLHIEGHIGEDFDIENIGIDKQIDIVQKNINQIIEIYQIEATNKLVTQVEDLIKIAKRI